MKVRGTLGMAAVLSAALWLMPVIEATVVVPADLAELTRDARSIARGRVVAVDAQWTEGRRTIETLVTLEAADYLKGRLGTTVQFRVPGGTLGRFTNLVVGAPRFSVGQQVIVFLGAQGPMVPYILGLSQGVFRLSVDAAGTWTVAASPLLLDGKTPGVRGSASPVPAMLSDFERHVRTLASEGR